MAVATLLSFPLLFSIALATTIGSQFCVEDSDNTCDISDFDDDTFVLTDFDADCSDGGEDADKNDHAECPEGFVSIRGSCYFMGTNPETFQSAMISCMNLAVPSRIYEPREFETSKAVDMFARFHLTSSYWLGVNKPCTSPSDMVYLSDEDSLHFTNWIDAASSSGDCAISYDGWDRTSCDNFFYYVCEQVDFGESEDNSEIESCNERRIEYIHRAVHLHDHMHQHHALRRTNSFTKAPLTLLKELLNENI